MNILVLAATLALTAAAQDGGPEAGGISTTAGGLSTGAADKAPTANPTGGGSGGACSSQPERASAPAPSAPFIATKDFGRDVFPDVEFFDGKLYAAMRGAGVINLYESNPDLSGLKLKKEFKLLPGAGGFPRLGKACGTLWMAYRDGEPAEAGKLWRLDTGAIEDLGPIWGNNPVAVENGMVAWQSTDGSVYTRALQGGAKKNAGKGLPTGISRIKPDGTVRFWDEDRLAVPWGIGAWFAGDLIVAEDFHDSGVWVSIAGSKPAQLWKGTTAFMPRAATNGAGLYAVGVWQPTARVAVFNAAGVGMNSAAADGELIIWAYPQHNDSGSGVVGLGGAALPKIRKVEILVNLKKVGDANLQNGVWHYDLNTAPYSGGINVSALGTMADGKTSRQTIRFNVRR